MLKSIKVSNFHSIGTEQEMSFVITKKDILNDSACLLDDSNGVNLVSCVIGANASGKTTLLKAISFIFWFIYTSYTKQNSDDFISVNPHQLKKDEPSKIELEFFNKEILYRYAISFNQKEVLQESLVKDKHNKIIFELNRNDEQVIINAPNLKINEADEIRFKTLNKVALLSSLIHTGYLSEITFFKYFASNVNRYGNININASLSEILANASGLIEDNSLRNYALGFIKSVGLSIEDFKLSEIINKNNFVTKNTQMLNCVHRSQQGDFLLPIYEESNGTQQGLSVLLKLWPVLQAGGLVVFDELESGLHPDLAKKIISLFENKHSNPHGAQLIFSTHAHVLLNDRTKTQIFIAEKNDVTLETEIYRLDDVQGVRNDENYFHKYMAGAYGGNPKVNWL